MADEYKEHIWKLLRTVQKKTRHHILMHCQRCGISVQEAMLLKELQCHPDIGLAELGDLLGLSKSTVSSMVARLEERRIIIREIPETNRRTVRLRVSQEYLQSPEIAPLKEQLVNGLFKEMSPEDAGTIIRGLEKLNEMLE